MMFNDTLFDELSWLESDVVEPERQLAEQEALIVDLTRQHQNASTTPRDNGDKIAKRRLSDC
jgi:hypothetical protein